MSTMEGLRAELFTYGRRLGDGLAWWLDELHAMARATVPPPNRWTRTPVAERIGEGAYRLVRRGRPDRVHRPDDRPVDAALLLPPALALTRLLWRPPLPERDLRRMTDLDLDRLTPFARETVYALIEVLRQADEAGRRQVRIAVAPRAQADEFVARAVQEGIRPKALLISDTHGMIDILPKMRSPQRALASRLSLAGWGLVAALLALNLAAAIWRDVESTQRLEHRVAVQAPHMAQIAAARGELKRLQTQAALEGALRARADPLAALAALSRALPASANVERLAWDESSLRVIGEAGDGVDVAAALRHDPILAEVRASDGEGPALGSHFDLVAPLSSGPISPMSGAPKR